MNGTLIAYDQKVGREVLSTLYVPEATDTFKPIPHDVLIDTIEEALSFRHIRITNSEFALSKDGMKMFGLLQVNAEYEGVQFAIGCRNANDKSMRLGLVAGYKVLVCQNMALSGDFKPLLAKHTKNLDLIESVSMGIDRIQRGWQPLRDEIDRKRTTHISEEKAKLLIFDAFTKHKFPVSLFKTVTKEFAQTEDPTIWSLENNFTEAFKKLQPTSQFEMAAKLPKLLGGAV